MSMKEDRAREGKKARYRKMGFGPMMDRGDIDFGDKHPLTKKKLKNFKKKENPMFDERFYQQRKTQINKAGVSTKKMLTGGQAKIAAKAPPPNKIDAKDFAVLKAEKAKGRGMGLQDESVKPGKIQKAALGVLALGLGAKKMKEKGKMMPLGMGASAFLAKKKKEMLGKRAGGVAKYKKGSGIKLPKEGSRLLYSGYSKPFEGPQHKGRVAAIVGVKPGSKIGQGRRKFKSLDDMRKAKGFKPGETSSQFNKRRMMLEGAKKAAKANKYGKAALGVAAAGMGAIQYLKSKMNKKKDNVKKKMGGGMMQKPMGYKHGSEPGAGLLGGKRTGKAGLLGGTGTVKESGKRSVKDTQRGKKRENYFTIKFPKKEGPANKETTIKEIKLRSRDQLGKAMSRMGGGMMQKPMGYRSGTMIKARGCKLGRTRPTKIT